MSTATGLIRPLQAVARSPACRRRHIRPVRHRRRQLDRRERCVQFLGSGAFTNTAGPLRAYQDSGTGTWFIEGNVNGDGVADPGIDPVCQNNHNLGANDFLF
jgi:hypothetical protein